VGDHSVRHLRRWPSFFGNVVCTSMFDACIVSVACHPIRVEHEHLVNSYKKDEAFGSGPLPIWFDFSAVKSPKSGSSSDSSRSGKRTAIEAAVFIAIVVVVSVVAMWR
jgi:hypothetical protein